MWDPVSMLYVMWLLNVSTPEARLNVQSVVEANRQALSERIHQDITLRVN